MQNQTQQTLNPLPQSTANAIGFKSVAKYTLLPGIFPSMRRLSSRFGHLLFIFTSIFGSVGLIDRNHPCLRPENVGLYKFTDILGMAANNVVFDRKHIPQVVMFLAVISTLLLIASMLGVAVFGVLFHTAQAHAQYFSNPATGAIPAPPAQDWAYQFLHRVFGITGMSGIWDGTEVDNAYAIVLREMLKTYSFALLVIAVFILIYIIVNVLAESARTGKPFGDKFDSIWAPIRLATAIGLLVPISGGYNSAQLITFQVADWGSALATNVWTAGLSKFDSKGLVKAADPDPNYRFVRAYFLIRLCQEGWNNFSDAAKTGDDDKVRAWVVPGSIEDKKIMRFKYGTVNDHSFCGEVEVPQLTKDEKAEYGKLASENPPQYIRKLAYDIRNLHSVSFNKLRCSGIQQDVEAIVDKFQDGKTCSMDQITKINSPVALDRWIVDNYWAGLGYNGSQFFSQTVGVPGGACTNGSTAVSFARGNLQGDFNLAGKELMATMKGGATHGWAAAGSFYLQLAQSLSRVSEAVGVSPRATLMPRIMSYQMAIPTKPDTQPITLTSTEIEEMCKKPEYAASCQLYRMLTMADKWFKDAPAKDPVLANKLDYDGDFSQQMRDTTETKALSSASQSLDSIDSLNILGIKSIPDENTNPITFLVEMGNQFRSMGYKFYFLAIVLSSSVFGSSALGSILQTFGSIYLLAGFTLSFVVPLMPFLNFAFGVLEWIMTVFEAIVGMPLWALSFLTREGGWFEGRPMEGVMLLFEMFLRPTILIFALLGAMMIFSAGVKFFNQAFQLYLDSAPEEMNAFGVFNNLGYTVVYVFVMYSLGNSCFKLIVKMPDMFLRWYGKNVNGFGGIMEAGVSDVNPYIISQYADKLSSGAAAAGTAGVSSAHEGYKENRAQTALNRDQENVAESRYQARDLRGKADQASQQLRDMPNPTQSDHQHVSNLKQAAERAETDAQRDADMYSAKTGAGVDADGNPNELTGKQWEAYRQNSDQTNSFRKRRLDPTRIMNRITDGNTTNQYDRVQEEIRQKYEGAPKDRANKAEAERRADTQARVFDKMDAASGGNGGLDAGAEGNEDNNPSGGFGGGGGTPPTPAGGLGSGQSRLGSGNATQTKNVDAEDTPFEDLLPETPEKPE